MPNIYDSAYDLEKAIRNSDEFKNLQAKYNAVMADPAAKELFDRFRNTQMELQEKQMGGGDITEEEVENARQIVEEVQDHTEIAQLMEVEQNLNTVISEISEIITKPLQELYGNPDNNQMN